MQWHCVIIPYRCGRPLIVARFDSSGFLLLLVWLLGRCGGVPFVERRLSMPSSKGTTGKGSIATNATSNFNWYHESVQRWHLLFFLNVAREKAC
jgi:hypothetical protein